MCALLLLEDPVNIAYLAVQSTMTESTPDRDFLLVKGFANHCYCKTDICQCGSNLGVTERNFKEIFAHLGFADGCQAMSSEGYRMDTLHIWGTHELSTNDLLEWLENYGPKAVEWIDDSSCNIVFADEITVLRILTKLTEPFDCRIALAAMAAVVSSMDSGTESIKDSVVNINKESLSGTTANLVPPNGRWFKSISSPKGAFCLYLRIAHKSDVKLPGAERRSKYYRRFGKPNADPPTIQRHSAIRSVTLKDPRELVVYDDTVDYSSPSWRNPPSGRRREAAVSGLSKPPRNPPPKWPRRSGTTVAMDIGDEDVFQPPLGTTPNFDFVSRPSVHQRLGPRSAFGGNRDALATVTILPDGESAATTDAQPVRMLSSLSMVADLEEQATKRNIFDQTRSSRRAPRRHGRGRLRLNERSATSVWSRLG